MYEHFETMNKMSLNFNRFNVNLLNLVNQYTNFIKNKEQLQIMSQKMKHILQSDDEKLDNSNTKQQKKEYKLIETLKKTQFNPIFRDSKGTNQISNNKISHVFIPNMS